jgi:hypothetical protein
VDNGINVLEKNVLEAKLSKSGLVSKEDPVEKWEFTGDQIYIEAATYFRQTAHRWR